jgi:hypothetical protein
MRRKYIVAGNQHQAQQWVSAQEPEKGTRYIYVSYPDMLHGMSFGPEDVVYVGTYWENPEFTAITRQLNLVHLMAKKVNGK